MKKRQLCKMAKREGERSHDEWKEQLLPSRERVSGDRTGVLIERKRGLPIKL